MAQGEIRRPISWAIVLPRQTNVSFLYLADALSAPPGCVAFAWVLLGEDYAVHYTTMAE